MNLLERVSRIKTTAMPSSTTAKPAASERVLACQECGRHGISITAGQSTVYIGGADVTTSNGIPVSAGTTVTIPVFSIKTDPVYAVGGAYILGEYF